MAITKQGISAYLERGKGTFLAGSAISKGQILVFSAEGTVVPASVAGTNSFIIAAQDIASGSYGEVCILGGSEVLAGAAIAAAGTLLTNDTNGNAVASTTKGDCVIGYNTGVSGASGDIIPLIVSPSLHP